jgi:hypothetical protein
MTAAANQSKEKLNKTRIHALSDESIYKKHRNDDADLITRNNLNYSMSNLSEYEVTQSNLSNESLLNSQGLNKISRETSNLYASNNFNSQFILIKPQESGNDQNQSYKNYIDINNFVKKSSYDKSPLKIDVIQPPVDNNEIYNKMRKNYEKINKNLVSRSYEINDIYY